MNWSNLLDAALSVGALSGLLFFFRDKLSDYLFKRIQHRFDVKLAEVQSDFRTREATLERLTHTALSSIAARQTAIDKRRVEAVEQIWAAVHLLQPCRFIATWMSTLKFEPLAKLAERDERGRAVLQHLSFDAAAHAAAHEKASTARPFLSSTAWAYFSAYSAVLGYAVAQMTIIKMGQKADLLAKPDAVTELVAKALPHQTSYLDQWKISGAYMLLDELEERLLGELQAFLNGSHGDEARVTQTAELLKLASQIQAGNSQQLGAEATKAGVPPDR